mmetsp:Transcript_51859/g.70714  ORF Transcript_51859/g.70714 Transcript_51859/m.70714 type:complete len:258 (-) Transcript_51859:335-1108(-)
MSARDDFCEGAVHGLTMMIVQFSDAFTSFSRSSGSDSASTFGVTSTTTASLSSTSRCSALILTVLDTVTTVSARFAATSWPIVRNCSFTWLRSMISRPSRAAAMGSMISSTANASCSSRSGVASSKRGSSTSTKMRRCPASMHDSTAAPAASAASNKSPGTSSVSSNLRASTILLSVSASISAPPGSGLAGAIISLRRRAPARVPTAVSMASSRSRAASLSAASARSDSSASSNSLVSAASARRRKRNALSSAYNNS